VQIIKFELYKIYLNYALLYKLGERESINLLSHLWKLSPKLELRTLAGYSYPCFSPCKLAAILGCNPMSLSISFDKIYI